MARYAVETERFATRPCVDVACSRTSLLRSLIARLRREQRAIEVARDLRWRANGGDLEPDEEDDGINMFETFKKEVA